LQITNQVLDEVYKVMGSSGNSRASMHDTHTQESHRLPEGRYRVAVYAPHLD